MPTLKVARVADFANITSKTVSVIGRKIAIFKELDGGFRATEASCRHQNADLSGGKRTGDLVECPRHGWRYNLVTGACLTEEWASLRTFDVKVEGDWIYVSLGGENG